MSGSRGNDHNVRNLVFINQDANPRTSNEAVRVHVMRETHRARRQLRGMLRQTRLYGEMTMFSESNLPNPQQQNPRQYQDEEESPDQSPVVGLERQRLAADSTQVPELKRLAYELLSSTLADSNTVTTSALQMLRNLPNSIFDLCDEDSAALYGLLALVMCTRQSIAMLQAAEYESFALESLRQRLSDSSLLEHSDTTIITIFLLSKLEVSFATQAFVCIALTGVAHAYESRNRWVPRSSPVADGRG